MKSPDEQASDSFLGNITGEDGALIGGGYGPEFGLSDPTRDPGLWYYQPLERPWLACQRIVVTEGRPVVAELRIVAVADQLEPIGDDDLPPEGLTNRISRLVKTRAHLDSADQLIGTELGKKLFTVYFGEQLGSKFKERSPKTRAMDVDYAQLAARYVDKVSRGNSKPVQELASEMGLETPRVRDLIHEARRRDLLSRMPRGQAGGELTEKAESLLQGQLEEERTK